MPLLLYLLVLLVSVSSVLFGLGWLAAPQPQYKAPTVQNASTVPAGADANTSPPFRPVYPILPTSAQAAPASRTGISASPPMLATTSAAAVQTEAEVTPAPAPPGPACDIEACMTAYYSFRASDCTYQPYEGPRRLCTKGKLAEQTQAKPEANAARAQAPTCNVTACTAAYRTFDPADCTYHPLRGPRRFCAK